MRDGAASQDPGPWTLESEVTGGDAVGEGPSLVQFSRHLFSQHHPWPGSSGPGLPQ